MSPAPPDWFEHLAALAPTLTEGPFTSFPVSSAPDDGSVRHSAVLVLFGPGTGTGPDILLTQRAPRMRAHAGQVAFPGGRIDPGDVGPEAAALREAVEETRLEPTGVQIRGCGPLLFLPVTNFLVTPVIAWWQRPSPVAPGNPAEVTRVVAVPLAELTDPANRFVVDHPSGYSSPGFTVSGLFVWGFTAAVLSWLISLAGLEQPWDAGRRLRVPSSSTSASPSAAAEELSDQLTEQLDEQVTE